MASVSIDDIPVAEEDASSIIQDLPESGSDAIPGPVEASSDASDIIIEGQRIQMRSKLEEAIPIHTQYSLRNRLRLHYAIGSRTLPGHFDFVKTATITDPSTNEKSLVNVTAAYIPAGNHMRLYIGYPYFGNNTLEHDPSIGVENIVPWLPTNVLLILIGSTVIIGVAVAAVKLRKRPVNFLRVK